MAKVSKQSLQRLKEQREKLNARIQKHEAMAKTSERKKDTRKKILLGSYYLDNAIKEDKLNDIKSLMSSYLKRNSDRELFGLELILEAK